MARREEIASDYIIKYSDDIQLVSESLFAKLLGDKFTKGTTEEDYKHIDGYLNGVPIDIKGFKNPHKMNHVLIEIQNVNGDIGWCSPESKAKLIAFQFSDGFYVVKKDDLYKLVLELCEPLTKYPKRENGLDYYINRYQWLGRIRRNDIFTYIQKKDLLSLRHRFIKT